MRTVRVFPLVVLLLCSAPLVIGPVGCLTTEEIKRRDDARKLEADLARQAEEAAKKEAEEAAKPAPDQAVLAAIQAERARLAAELDAAKVARATLEAELKEARISRGLSLTSQGIGVAQMIVGLIPPLAVAAPFLSLAGTGIEAIRKSREGGTA